MGTSPRLHEPLTARQRAAALVAAAVLAWSALAGCASEPATCLAGSRICDGAYVMVCHPLRHRFEPEIECPRGTSCLSGQCVTTRFPDGGLVDTALADTPADQADGAHLDAQPDPGPDLPPDARPDAGMAQDVPGDAPADAAADAVEDAVADAGTAADAVEDAAADAGTAADAVEDAGTDAVEDAGTDAAGDAVEDAVEDAAADAVADAVEDAAADTAGDAVEDAAADAVEDAAADAVADAVEDAVADTVADAAPDAGPPPDPYDPGLLLYEKIPNLALQGEAHRVRWHPSAAYALILGGKAVVYYDHASRSLTPLGTLGKSLADLDVAPDGSYFVVVGVGADDVGRLWRVHVEDPGTGLDGLTLVVDDEQSVTYGQPVGVDRDPDAAPGDPEPPRFVVGTRVSTSSLLNYFLLYDAVGGLHDLKGYNASGACDLMWGRDPGLYGGSAIVLSANGCFGNGSMTWVLATGDVVANGFSPGFGNPGSGAWRPGGLYGMFTGWSSNKMYVYDGAWHKATLPFPTGAAPQAVAFRHTGTRALVVGRAIGTPLYATVTEHRPGQAAGYQDVWLDQRIPAYDQAPWFAPSSNAYLSDVDWRPHACDEGLIVGTANTAGYAIVIRFYDQDDPVCEPAAL